MIAIVVRIVVIVRIVIAIMIILLYFGLFGTVSSYVR